MADTKRKDFLTELRGLDVASLQERGRVNAEEAMKLRFNKLAGQLEQSHRLSELRRQQAQIQTILVEKRNNESLAAGQES